MTLTHIFGYGSLVNARTHDFAGLEPASLVGYRRVWQPSPLRRVAYLTVVESPGAEVLGATAEVPSDAWPALDERERAYSRRSLPGNAVGGRDGVAVYAVHAIAPPDPGQPILLSYLDVVVQGFHDLHGDDGARDFFASTEGWDTPVLDDRIAPRYARAQSVKDGQRALVDEQLARVGATLLQLSDVDDDLWMTAPPR